MRGQILVFNTPEGAGVIATAGGVRFLFYASDWQSAVPPQRGMAVDFTLGGANRAWQVRQAPEAACA